MVAVLISISTPTGSSEFDPLVDADGSPPETVAIPAGTFTMGSDDGPPDERPAHALGLNAFRMDATEVTNARFAAFVKATGYTTVAERTPDRASYPGHLRNDWCRDRPYSCRFRFDRRNSRTELCPTGGNSAPGRVGSIRTGRVVI